MPNICDRGVFCLKYGCPRLHPEGRYVGVDCEHDHRCRGRHPSKPHFPCPYHHTNPAKNDPQKMNLIMKNLNIEKKLYCLSGYKYKCGNPMCQFPHYDEVVPKPYLYAPKPEPEPKVVEKVVEREVVKVVMVRQPKCSCCGEKGHNKRTCRWADVVAGISKLPPPVV